MLRPLAGKGAIVTGGGAGIGAGYEKVSQGGSKRGSPILTTHS